MASDKTQKNTPSLLEPQSRGGEDASKGFDFQLNFLISQIPIWLQYDGFMGLTHESIGDIEVKFYSPGYPESIEMIEVKNNRLTPHVFWEEVERFYTVDKGSHKTYRWFRIVAPEISDELNSLQNGLRRIRSPYTFYSKSDGVIQHSMDDFTQIVEKAGKPLDYADFIFQRVLIDIGYGMAQDHGEALFRQNFGAYIPEYQHVSYANVSNIYRAAKTIVAPSNTLISRKTIEETIRTQVPQDQVRPYVPVRLHTLHDFEDIERKELVGDWIKFFGGTQRSYPPTSEWDEELIVQMREIKNFILSHRKTKNLLLSGSRRLSVAIAIGSVFSATSGFTLSMKYRDGTLWRTDDHAGENDHISLDAELSGEQQADDLIVAIGIPNSIEKAVQTYTYQQGARNLPFLNIVFPRPIETSSQANAIVAQVKSAILHALSQTQASHIHLFCAVPSFLALLLGHRLNATAVIHCYEHTGSSNYVATCTLNT